MFKLSTVSEVGNVMAPVLWQFKFIQDNDTYEIWGHNILRHTKLGIFGWEIGFGLGKWKSQGHVEKHDIPVGARNVSTMVRNLTIDSRFEPLLLFWTTTRSNGISDLASGWS
jgi:hypothetical protein